MQSPFARPADRPIAGIRTKRRLTAGTGTAEEAIVRSPSSFVHRARTGHRRRLARLTRARICTGLILAAWVGLASAPDAVHADCVPDSTAAQTGDSVTCTGRFETGFEAGAGVQDLRIMIVLDALMENPAPGSAVIQINSNNPGDGAGTPGVSNNAVLVILGDGSAGIRATGSGAPTDFNYVLNTGLIRDAVGQMGSDVVGIDLGDRGVVEHQTDSDTSRASIDLLGDRSIGIRVGDDGRIEAAAPINVGRTTDGVPAAESPIGILLGDGTAGRDAGLLVTSVVSVYGTDSRGTVVGSGWTGSNGIIEVSETGTIRAFGDDAVALTVGDDSRVEIQGRAVGVGDGAIGIEMGDQTIANPDAMLLVTGTVLTNNTDATAVSLGSKVAAPGTTIVDSFTPVFQVGTLSVGTPGTGDTGEIVNDYLGGPLVVFRDQTSELNHMLVADGSRVVADETAAFEPNRGIAIEGTDGVERIDNYGELGGKIFLRDGDDIVHFGPGSSHSGFMSLNAGAGFDTLELLNRWAIPTDGTPTSLDLERFTQFEHVQLGEGAWRLGGSFAGASPGATLRVEDTGRLIVGEPLRVDGDIDFAPGSTLEVELSGVTTTGYLESNGVVTIESDAPDTLTSTLDITLGGAVQRGSYVLISSALLNGEFEVVNLPSNPDFRFANVVYDAAGGTLTLDVDRNSYAFNREVTDAYFFQVNDPGASTELQTTVEALFALSQDEYLAALDQLHPEIYDTQTSLQLALGRQFQQTMLDRPGHCIAPSTSGKLDPRTKIPCRPRPLDVWVTGFGLIRDRDGADGHVSWQDGGGGVAMGIDHRRGDDLLLTATLGGAHGSTDLERGERGTLSTIDAGVLAAWTRGPALVQGFFSYGHGWHDAERSVAFEGVTPTLSTAEFQTDRVAAGTELRWTFALDGLDLSPAFDVDWARIMRPGFSEIGGSPVALTVGGSDDDVVTLRVGVDLGTSLLKKGYWTDFLEKTDGVWQPELSVRWRQTVAGYERDLTSSIIGAPTGTGTSTVRGDDANQGFEIGAGLWFTPKGATRVTLGARYDAFVWKDVVSHDLKGTVSYSF